jgi:hypothetical protein
MEEMTFIVQRDVEERGVLALYFFVKRICCLSHTFEVVSGVDDALTYSL